MEAIILCGGFATRLEPITYFVPKPLLPVNGRPILDYIMESINGLGLKRITISANKKFADQFALWVERSGYKNSMELRLVVEPTTNDGEKLGAVGGIEYVIENAGIDDDLMIIAGDNLYDFDMKKLHGSFRESGKPTIGLYDIKSKDEARRFGVVRVENGRITEFAEKPENPESTLISTGIYALPRKDLGSIKSSLDDKNHRDSPGYFIKWLAERKEVQGVVYEGRWFDIGTIDTYKAVFDQYIG